MDTWVLNVDTETDRWDTINAHLAEFGGLVVQRWSATTPDKIAVPDDWTGPDDAARRLAILHSYRALLTHLAASDRPEWLILQDDIRLTEHPKRLVTGRLMHLYGGHERVRGPVVNPWYSSHVCPRAFLLKRAGVEPLLEAWTDETRSACRSWTTLINQATTTFDMPPTAVINR